MNVKYLVLIVSSTNCKCTTKGNNAMEVNTYSECTNTIIQLTLIFSKGNYVWR